MSNPVVGATNRVVLPPGKTASGAAAPSGLRNDDFRSFLTRPADAGGDGSTATSSSANRDGALGSGSKSAPSAEALAKKRERKQAYLRKKAEKAAATGKAYRDRAAERRAGINPDYEDDLVILTGGRVGTDAPAAPGAGSAATPLLAGSQTPANPLGSDAGAAAIGENQLQSLQSTNAESAQKAYTDRELELKRILLGHDVTQRTFNAEETKYLGGDLKHTHLVKGLDYALLEQTRREVAKQEQEQEHQVSDIQQVGHAQPQQPRLDGAAAPDLLAADKPAWIRSLTAAIFVRHPEVNEMMKPGRTALQFRVDGGRFGLDQPVTRVVRPKDELPDSLSGRQAEIEALVIRRLRKVFRSREDTSAPPVAAAVRSGGPASVGGTAAAPPTGHQLHPNKLDDDNVMRGGDQQTGSTRAFKIDDHATNKASSNDKGDVDDDDDDDIFGDLDGSYVCEELKDDTDTGTKTGDDSAMGSNAPHPVGLTLEQVEQAAKLRAAEKAKEAAADARTDAETGRLLTELLDDVELDQQEPVGPSMPSGGGDEGDTIADPDDAYPTTEDAYPNTDDAYPNTVDAYPNTDNAYPNTDNAYPNTDNAYPNTDNAYPNTDNAYPNTDDAYPDTDNAYPNTDDAYRPSGDARSNAVRPRAVIDLPMSKSAIAYTSVSLAPSEATRRRNLARIRQQLGFAKDAGGPGGSVVALDDGDGDDGDAYLGLSGGRLGDASDIKALKAVDEELERKMKRAQKRKQRDTVAELEAAFGDDYDGLGSSAAKRYKGTAKELPPKAQKQREDKKLNKQFKQVKKIVQKKTGMKLD